MKCYRNKFLKSGFEWTGIDDNEKVLKISQNYKTRAYSPSDVVYNNDTRRVLSYSSALEHVVILQLQLIGLITKDKIKLLDIHIIFQ